MNMKKLVKKPLAIAVLMLTFGGVANIAHASSATTIYTQDVSASKEIKEPGVLKIALTATPDEIVAGTLANDTTIFILKVSDTAKHSGWRLHGTGSSVGGYMYEESNPGKMVALHASSWTWAPAERLWRKSDSGSAEVEEHLYVTKGVKLEAGKYCFTGRVEEYL